MRPALSPASTEPSVDPVTVHLSPATLDEALCREVAVGLGERPWELSPKWLYDDRGCELFEQITTLPEYYPTRTERAILAAHAGDIATSSRADTLVELGSGTSDKTRLLLDAFSRAGALDRFVAFDVAEATLRGAVESLAATLPGVEVRGVVGDFNEHLHTVPRGGRRMFVFLGGTIGNLDPEQRSRFLVALRAQMEPGDTLLLGTDLVKDRARLVAAYDDAEGVTAAFNRNLLAVLNRELGADFVLDAFDHVARFDEEGSFIEMRLRSRVDQRVHIPRCDLVLDVARDDDLRTEISTKFTPDRVRGELTAAGLAVERRWSDPADDFALWLARR